MNFRSQFNSASTLAFSAISDTWLQIRSKPSLYILIWTTLSLVPQILLGRIFAKPFNKTLEEFLQYIEFLSNTNTVPITSNGIRIIRQFLGLSGVLWIISILILLYYMAVLFSTVYQFRSSKLPQYTDSIMVGFGHYFNLLRSVLFATWKIFWKPMASSGLFILLNTLTGFSFFSSMGFIVGVALTISGIYRYALIPFIYLSTDLSHRESGMVSYQFYIQYRSIVITLFFWFLFLPIITIIFLILVSMQTGVFFGIGGFVVWFAQSIIQFIVLMALSNFAIGTFSDLESTELFDDPE